MRFFPLALTLCAVACLPPRPPAQATNAAIGGLLAFDLEDCVQRSETWEAYDRCEAALVACAHDAKTAQEYDACSDKALGRDK